jgi:hypothetical protein
VASGCSDFLFSDFMQSLAVVLFFIRFVVAAMLAACVGLDDVSAL